MRNSPVLEHNLEYCFLCGRPSNGVHHLLFGSDRRNADEDGIYIAICDACHIMGKYRIHDNPTAERLSKQYGETLWLLKEATTEEQRKQLTEKFIKRYGRSYL